MPQSKGWEEKSDRPKKRSCGSNAFSHFTRHLIGGIKKGLAGTKGVIDPTETLRLAAFYWNDLDAEWKQKFSQQPEIQRKEHSAISKPKPKKKTKQVQTCLRTRCSPKLLVSRNLQLTDDQKVAILNLNPFHSLLNGQCNCLNREFIMKLVDRFNPQTRTIEFRNGVRCKITKDDFARVLGMPKGDIAVPRECSQQHRNRIADRFEGECQQPEKALQLSVLGRVLGKKQCDDQFQRAYMLFVLGCFLCPTTKDEVGSRLFPSVATDSLQRMKSYKWPQFLLDWLVEEVTSYKERRKSSRSSAGPGVPLDPVLGDVYLV